MSPTGRLLAALLCLSLAAPALAQEWPDSTQSVVREVAEFPFDQEHLRLAVRLDAQARRVEGDARLTLRALDDDVRHVLLHASGLRIDSVLVGRPGGPLAPATYEMRSADHLRVDLSPVADAFPDGLVPEGGRIDVRITYAAGPSRALRFEPETEAGGPRVWTRGRPETSRYWYPTHDMPYDRFTSELRVTVHRPLRVVAGGEPTGEADNPDGTATFTFVQHEPHASDGLAFAAAPFAVTVERFQLPGGRLLPLVYAVPAGQADAALPTFGRTPELVRFLSNRLGYVYPWEQYAQAVVDDGSCAGAVGAGSALFSGDVLTGYDDDRDPAPALVRRLAEQYFGQLVTPGQWADSWLTDGISAYVAAHFVERDRGAEAFAEHMRALEDRYFALAAGAPRPLVWDGWRDAEALYSGYTEARGAWVAHQLRLRLGDAAFWNAIDRYLTANAFRAVSTQDLLRAVGGDDGEIRAFFDQWVYGAGHPVVEASQRYEDGTLHLTLRQTQEGPGVPEAFRLTVPVEVGLLGDAERFSVEMDRREQTFTLALDGPPRFVALDPERTLLARFRVDQPATAWVAQLRYASNVPGRLAAARALPRFRDDPALLIALRNAYSQEPDASVRIAVLEAAAALPSTDAARRFLVSGYEDDDPAVRAAALEALGGYPGDAEIGALAARAAQGDAAPEVQAAAVRLMARNDADGALTLLRSALVTPSPGDVIRRAALRGLVDLEIPEADKLEFALAYSGPDHSPAARAGAVDLLAALAPTQRRALDRLVDLVDAPAPAVRRAAASALAGLDLERAREALASRPALIPCAIPSAFSTVSR